MDWLTNLLWYDGKFLGVEWSLWKVVGYLGTITFGSRFFVQWYVTEKKRQVTVPAAFWWLSLTGALLTLSYALRQKDSVFILAYVFTWIPYVRNLIIHYQHKKAHLDCPNCGMLCPPKANYCAACGTRVARADAPGVGQVRPAN